MAGTHHEKCYVRKQADLSAITVSTCVTRFHCLSHGLTVGSSFLTVLQIFSGFSFKLKTNKATQSRQKNIVAWSSTYKKVNK